MCRTGKECVEGTLVASSTSSVYCILPGCCKQWVHVESEWSFLSCWVWQPAMTVFDTKFIDRHLNTQTVIQNEMHSMDQTWHWPDHWATLNEETTETSLQLHQHTQEALRLCNNLRSMPSVSLDSQTHRVMQMHSQPASYCNVLPLPPTCAWDGLPISWNIKLTDPHALHIHTFTSCVGVWPKFMIIPSTACRSCGLVIASKSTAPGRWLISINWR